MKVNFNEALRKAVAETIEDLYETGGDYPCWYCENRGDYCCAHTVTINGETFFDDDYNDDALGCDKFSPDQKAIEWDIPSIEKEIEEKMERSWHDI